MAELVHIGLGVEERLGAEGAIDHAGVRERMAEAGREVVWVGTGGQQPADDAVQALLAGEQQRRHAVAAGGVGVCVGVGRLRHCVASGQATMAECSHPCAVVLKSKQEDTFEVDREVACCVPFDDGPEHSG
eukprot:scaffold3348_cov113-Isochrysis_galbana.AAC.3